MRGNDLALGLRIDLQGNKLVVQQLDGIRVAVNNVAGDVERSTSSTQQASAGNKRYADSFVGINRAIAAPGLATVGQDVDKSARSTQKATTKNKNYADSFVGINRAIAAPGLATVGRDVDKSARSTQKATTKNKNYADSFAGINRAIAAPGLATVGRNVDKSARSTQKATAENKRYADSFGLLRKAIAAVGLAAFGREMVQYADGWTQINNRLRLVTDSEEQLTDVRKKLFAVSQDTRAQFTASVNAYAKLSMASETLGRTDAEVLRVIETLNKAIAIGGSTAIEGAAGMLQLTQGIASNNLAGEELKSVMENLLGVSNALIDGFAKLRKEGQIDFDVTRANIRDLAADGVLSADLVLQALLAVSSEVDDKFKNLDKTISQAFTNLDNSIGRLVGLTDEASNTSSAIAGSVSSLAESIDSLQPGHLAATLELLLGFGAAKFLGPMFEKAAVGTVALAAGLMKATIQTNAHGQVVARTTPKIVSMTAATSGLNTALKFVGGYAGLAILAGTALYSYASSSLAAQKTTEQLRDEVQKLSESYSKLSVAQVTQLVTGYTTQLESLRAQSEETRTELANLYTSTRDPSAIADESERLQAVLKQLGDDTKTAKERLKALTALQKKLNKALKDLDTKSATKAADELAKAQQSLLDTLLPITKEQRKYNKDLKTLNSIYPESQRNTKEYKDLKKLLKAEYKLLHPWIAKTAKAEKAAAEQKKKNTKSNKELIASMTEELALMQLTDRERAINTAALKVEGDETGELTLRVRELAAAIYDKQAAIEATSESIDLIVGETELWKQAIGRVDDAFFDLWKSGLDSFDDFKDSLLDGFKTLIAQLIHQATTQKIVLSFASAMGLGGSGAASASGSASSAGGIGNMVSTAKSAYSFLSGGLGAAQGYAATGIAGIGNVLNDMGFEALADNVVNAGFENLVNASAAQLGLSLVGGIAGSYAGNKLGESVFGKQAESNWGATILGAVGTFFGGAPGAFIGATVGSMLDVAFGGDGKKRVKLGVGTGADLFNGGSVIDSMTADSGLELTALAKRVGDGTNGQSAVDMMNAFGGIDAALTDSTRGAGFAVDLSGVSLAGRGTQGEGRGPAAGFGSFGFNGLDPEAIENAPTEFIAAWIAEVSTTFDESLRNIVTGLGGSTEQMLADYQTALGLDQFFDDGGQIFDDVTSLADTFDLLTGQFRKTDETVADTVARLDIASALMGAIGGDTAHTVESLAAAQSQLDAVGTNAALQIVGTMNQLTAVQSLLSVDHIEEYKRSQESLWQVWERQADGVATLADNATTADLELLGAVIGELGQTTAQVVGQIFQAKDSIAESFGSLIGKIQMDLLGSDEARYESLRNQAEALAASISTLTDPQAILDATAQIEALSSQAYSLLGEQQQLLMGDDFIAFLEEVRASGQAQLDAALEVVQTQQDPSIPGSTANAVQSSFERMTDSLIERVNEATAQQQEAADRMEAAAAQQQSAASSFGGWVGGLPSSFNINLTVPEVG